MTEKQNQAPSQPRRADRSPNRSKSGARGSSSGGGYRKYVVPNGFVARAHSDVYHAGDAFDEHGVFESVRFGPTDDGFVIGNFSIEQGETIVAKGTVPGFVLGAPYHIVGKVVEDKKWGIQVNIAHAVGAKPTTEGQLESFLGSGAIPGIGHVTAKKIVKHFGTDTLAILENNPDRLAEVPGLGDKTVEKIKAELPDQLKYRDVIGFFASLGISVRTINRLIAEYGGGAKEIIEKNPYILCRVKGFAFSRADSIAKKMGIPLTDRNRLNAGLVAVMRYVCERDGHTVVPEDTLIARAQEMLEVGDITLLSNRLEELVRNKKVIKDANGYHLKHLYDAEKNIKKALSHTIDEDWLLTPDSIAKHLARAEKRKGFKLTDQQASGVYNVFKKKISVLSGAAGAGKAQPLYANVLTEHGWKKMGDLQLGDLVWTPKGTLAPVTGIFPQGEKEVFRITLVDGRHAECCSEHIWRTVKPHCEHGVESLAYVDMTLQEMIDAGICQHDVQYINGNALHAGRANDCYLPVSQAIPFEEKQLPVDPYVLGAFLAGGRFADGELTLSCSAGDEPIVDSIAETLGCAATNSGTEGHIWHFHADTSDGHCFQDTRAKDLLADFLKSSASVCDKHIPSIYKFSSVEQRWAVVQGLFDISGAIGDQHSADGDSLMFSSSSKRLIDDLAEVLRSLGVEVTMPATPDVVDITDEPHAHPSKERVLSARCRNGVKQYFFRLPWKKLAIEVSEMSEASCHHDMVAVTDIQDLGFQTEMQCIMIADPDHLYITDDYIVTHNTAVSSTIVEVCRMAGIPVCLMSPTGRAAKHLSDTCGGEEPGYTMHRALSVQMRKARDDDFFDEDQPKQFVSQNVTEAVKHFEEAQVVIADEASMMDTEMASILFKACKNKHLMLVGDPNQLPSVGPGRVLGDIMESSYATHHGILTFLTQVFRQKAGSPVIMAANAIQEGKSPAHIPGVHFYDVTSNEQVPEVIDKHVLPYLRDRQLGYENYAFLSPIKKTPHAGVDALNAYLRPRLNPYYKKPDDPNKEFLFQRGDFVMQTKNNYEVDIYNGDIGVVQEIDRDGGVEVLFSGDDEEICYEKDEVYNDHQIIPAFAMTVHKSQGDQYDTVVVVLTSSQFAMLNRNLLYTAVTRAENELILIGDAKAFAMAASNQKENKRLTGLRGI